MPAVTDPQALLASTKCFQCYSPNSNVLDLVELGILKSLVEGMPVSTDPQELLAAAKCYNCYAASPYMLQLIKIGLLLQLSGGTGTGSVLHGDGPPIGDSPGTDGKVYYDDLTGIHYGQLDDGSWI